MQPRKCVECDRPGYVFHTGESEERIWRCWHCWAYSDEISALIMQDTEFFDKDGHSIGEYA